GDASVYNGVTGIISASADADAYADDQDGESDEEVDALADADATAIKQDVDAGYIATANVFNDGLVKAYAAAEAYADEDAEADAEAVGVDQNVEGDEDSSATAYVSNTATISAVAFATVGGIPGEEVSVAAEFRPIPTDGADEGDGYATAIGIDQEAEDAL